MFRLVLLSSLVAVLTPATFPAPAPADGPGNLLRLTWSGPPSVHPGTPFTYTATVTNKGSVAAPVFLQETAGSRETSVSAVPSQGTCAVSGTDTRLCTLGEVPAGASATVTFTSKLSGVSLLAVSLTAMPTATGGPATFSSYPIELVAAGDPLQTDVRLTLSGPEEIHQWDLGTYTITARNADSVTAHGIVLEGLVGYDDRLVRAALGGQPCRRNPLVPEIVECDVGDLAPGASVDMRVDTAAYLSSFSQLRASITQDWNGTTVKRQFEREWIVPILPPVIPAYPPGGPGGTLTLSITHPDDVRVGTPFTWTETITNRGSVPSGPLTLALGSSFYRDMIEHDRAECTPAVLQTYCSLAGLPPGASTTLTFSGYPFDPSGGPAIHDDAVLSNGSQASVRWAYEIVNPGLPAADLSVEPVSQSSGRYLNSTANSLSTWRITNNGPNRAFDILVLDDVSPGTTKLNTPGCGLTWCTIDWLEPGASTTVALFSEGRDNPVHHTVRVYHGGADPLAGNNSATADAPAELGGGGGGGGGGPGSADLSLTGSVEPASAPIGGTLTWRLRVNDDKNFGPATGVVVDVALPAGMKVVSTAADRGPGCTANGVGALRCSLDWLSSDAPYGNITIVSSVTQAGELVLGATVRYSRADPNPADNTLSLRANTPVVVPPTPVRTPSTRKGITRTGSAKANVLVGTPFGDVLRGLGGNDRLLGKSGDDRLYGGAGNDTINGGPGLDLLDGGRGNDRISARDGQRDSIHCGAGRDTVLADPRDAIAGDCETIERP